MRDNDNIIWSAQALTADEVSYTNGNVYDLKLATNDISVGEPMAFVITVDVSADHTTGDETYAFEAIQSTVAALTSPDVLNRVAFTAAQATAGALVAGTQIVLPIPPGSITKEFIGINFDGGGNTPTITVTAYLVAVKDIGIIKTPPKNYTVTSA